MLAHCGEIVENIPSSASDRMMGLLHETSHATFVFNRFTKGMRNDLSPYSDVTEYLIFNRDELECSLIIASGDLPLQLMKSHRLDTWRIDCCA